MYSEAMKTPIPAPEGTVEEITIEQRIEEIVPEIVNAVSTDLLEDVLMNGPRCSCREYLPGVPGTALPCAIHGWEANKPATVSHAMKPVEYVKGELKYKEETFEPYYQITVNVSQRLLTSEYLSKKDIDEVIALYTLMKL